MKRFAAERRVFFWEEPIGCDHPLPYLEYHPFPKDNVIALRPRVPHWWSREQTEAGLRGLLDMLVATAIPTDPILWFYTPMMLGFAGHLAADTIVYDCMDELSAFAFADPLLIERENELIRVADVMFTGGYSLFEAKRDRHDAIHPFPSAVDVEHFATARRGLPAPADQAGIEGPKLGFYGVIDERIDLALIDAVAAGRPDWQFVMIGPVVKIDPAALPRRANIHWLGGRSYDELPAYLSGWDVALMPFAINAATRFISPTKTPEYLAAGRPVVSTAITDVIRHYGGIEAVAIATDAAGFIAACERMLAMTPAGAWRAEADRLLATTSWDRTFAGMTAAIAPRPRAVPAIYPADCAA
ncbi:MAG: glycosyltransferase [Rhizorhabdus sp.]